MSKPEIEIIEPNYEGISKMLDSLRDLYSVGAQKEIVNKALESYTKPIMFIEPLKLEGEIKPTNEITKSDIELLNWIYSRLRNYHREDAHIDFMYRLEELILKLEKNGK